MDQQKARKAIIAVVAAIVAVALVYWLLTMPDRRTTGEKLDDALHEMSEGMDKASKQLEDRTTGQKLGDSIDDLTKPK